MNDCSGVLKTAPFFVGIPAETMREMERSFCQTAYHAGDAIFFEGDLARSIYVVGSGEVKLYVASDCGHDVVLGVAAAGDAFGGSVFLKGRKHHLSASAVDDTVLLCLDGASFRDLILRFPIVALNIAAVLSDRLDEAHEQIRQLCTEPVERRLAHKLISLAAQVGVPADAGVRLDMRLKRQDLAEMIGTSVESVSRILSRWRRAGLVGGRMEQVIITGPHQLADIAEPLHSVIPV